MPAPRSRRRAAALALAAAAACHAAHVDEPTSGRVLDAWTTEPGLQLFTGNRFDGRLTGVGGHVLVPHAGFSLETQHVPDAINHPRFPSIVLRPGETFRSTTIDRFTALNRRGRGGRGGGRGGQH